MGFTNIEKDEVCEKHKEVIKAVYHIGNKVMLQSQLYEVLDLAYSKTKYSIDKALEELKLYEIIKFEQYLDTKYKLVILKKHAIKYIEKKATTQEVAAVPKKTTERALYSVIKTDKFLVKLDSYKQKVVNLGTSKKALNLLGCSAMYSKNQGLEYLKDSFSKVSTYKSENEMLEKTKNLKDSRNKNLKEGSEARQNKGTQGAERIKVIDETKNIKDKDDYIAKVEDGRTEIEKKIEKANMDTILNSNVFVDSVYVKDGKTFVMLELHDINNTQNHNKFLEQALICSYVFTKLFEGPIVINFNMKLLTDVAVSRMWEIYNSKPKGSFYDNYKDFKLHSYKINGGTKIYDECGFGGQNQLKINVSRSVLSQYRIYGD